MRDTTPTMHGSTLQVDEEQLFDESFDSNDEEFDHDFYGNHGDGDPIPVDVMLRRS